MKTIDIERGVLRYFLKYRYPMLNSYIFDWESDFFCISKSGYSYEIEIKVSRSDFLSDQKNKKDKYRILEASKPFVKKGFQQYNGQNIKDGKKTWFSYSSFGWDKVPIRTSIKFIFPDKMRPNKFIYACPENMISEDEIPDWAGLLYVRENKVGYSIYHKYIPMLIKQPKFLHRNKNDKLKDILHKKYMWDYKNKIQKQLLDIG